MVIYIQGGLSVSPSSLPVNSKSNMDLQLRKPSLDVGLNKYMNEPQDGPHLLGPKLTESDIDIAELSISTPK